MDPADRAVETLREARRIVILTGAGVSTESGVPDFRSSGGIWERFDPDDFRYEKFLSDPRGFWELRQRLMAALDLDRVRPNAAHVAIAAASRSDRVLGHVTQNIDGLFQAAGHQEEKLVEIHGSARRVRCMACLRFFSYSEISLATIPPACPACGGAAAQQGADAAAAAFSVVKPGMILFGEPLHEPDLARAEDLHRRADVVLVIGSSLVVHPAAGLPALALARGARLVIVTLDPTPYNGEADAVVRARAGEAVPAILRECGLI